MSYEVENEKLEKKSKRIKPLTLISGIIGLIFGLLLFAFAIYVGYSLFGTYMIKDTSSAGEAFAFLLTGWLIIPLFIVICLVLVVVGILNTVSGILSIVASTKDDKKYLSHKGLVITSIVFDYILLFIFVILTMFILSGSGKDFLYITAIVVTILSFISPIIKIVDLSIVSKRHKKHLSIQKEQDKYQKDHAVEDELTKYKNMYDNGVITKEEYEKMRAKILKIEKE